MRLPALPVATTPAQALPLWPPLLATRGPGGASGLHAHHALHFVIAVSGELRARQGQRGAWMRGAGVLTAPDVTHAIDARGCEIVLVFLDPESDLGTTLAEMLQGELRMLTPGERAALLPHADPLALRREGGGDFARHAVEALGARPLSAHRPVHPRVRKLLRLLRDNRELDLRLEPLAEAVGLSPGRLMHVFTESIGIPLRPYIAWLKLQRAAGAIASGVPLALAAQSAGFADAAHMSRTFRRMLGASPSELRPGRAD
jgi:AraC-like DNA-binding protein